MNKINAIILTLALTGFVASGLWAADPKPQTTCPVLTGNIDKSVYADYKGKRFIFAVRAAMQSSTKTRKST